MWSLGSFSQKAAASRRVSRPSFWRPLVFPALAVRPASVLNSLPEHVQSHQHQPPQAPTALSTEQHQDELSEFMPSGDLEPFVAKHAPKTKALSMYDWRLRAVSQREAHPGQLEGLRQVRIHGKDHFRLKWGTQPELEAFRTSYMELVALERDELEKEAEERLAKTKPDPAEGLTLWDLRVEVQHTKTSKDEILVCLNCDEAVLSRHQFRPGMACWVSKFVVGRANHPVEPGHATMGHILRVWPDRLDISVKLSKLKHLPPQARVDYAYDPTVIQRMTEALDMLLINRSAQFLEQTRMDRWANYAPRDKRISLIQRGTDLADFIAPPPSAAQHKVSKVSDLFTGDMRLHSWALRHSTTPPMMVMDGDPPLGSLNPVQIKAVAMALQHRMTIIQGPPGTGKSETIANIVYLLKAHFQVSCPILVCAPTNAAVDNLVGTLRRKSLKVLRMGRPMRIREDCQANSYDAVQERHPLFKEMGLLKTQLEEALDKLRRLGFRSAAPQEVARKINPLNETAVLALVKIIRDARQRGKELSRKIASDVLHGSDVILSTVFGGSERALDAIDFPFVLIDEAAQCNGPATLIPFMKGCKHAVLIGDHKQLSGLNKSQEAAMKGFNESLFERLIKNPTVASIMLQEQYRMAHDVADFPNTEFYGSRLITSGAGNRRLDSAFLPPHRTVVFLHHSHSEATSAQSLQNLGEGDIVLDVVTDLLRRNPDLRPREIGVISPYAAQTAFIKGLRGLGLHPDIEVHTVDGFQGREKRAIVLSTVRSNSQRTIGFLQDPRRLNVALTRAKDAMIIIGNKNTLSAGTERSAKDVWARLMKWLETEGLIATWKPNKSVVQNP